MDPEMGEIAPPLCPADVGKAISLSLSELASRAGMVTDAMLEHSRSPHIQRFLQGILEVHAKATEVWGDNARAADWMLAVPIHALDGKSAIALIAEDRTPDVVCYLDALGERLLRNVG